MISLRSLAAAFHKSIMIRRARQQAEAAFALSKQAEQAEREALWSAEKKRRQEDTLDADGSRAAAKAVREEQLKQERLDFIAAQYAIID